MSSSNSNPIEQLKTAQQQATVAPKPVSAAAPTPDLQKLMQEVLDLKKAVEAKDKQRAQAIANAKPPEIDWSKIEEKDIIDLSIDIPVIEQEIPSYLDVKLLDKNYISRWINTVPQRLGVCLAEGYSYVTKEDMDPRYPIFLAFDTSGHYSCGDVVALKILKSRYYPAIKANYMKTMAIHGKARLNQAVARGKSSVQLDKNGNEIKMGGLEPEFIDPSRLNVYDPGDEPSPGEKEWTKDMVNI